MKTVMAFWVCVLLVGNGGIVAADIPAGPHGGKLIGNAPDQAEVFIDDDGRVTIRFVDADGNVVPRNEQSVRLFAQPESGRLEIAMREVDGALVSDVPLPKPEGYLLVVQIRTNAESRPVNSRILYLMHVCGGCSLKEYACTCEDH